MPTKTAAIADFSRHLQENGLAPRTVQEYVREVRRFLNHVGNPPIERISEAQATQYFQSITKPATRRQSAMVVSRFLRFAAPKPPALTNTPEQSSARLPAIIGRKEAKLRQTWEAERAAQQQEESDKIVATLARQLISHYTFFKQRVKRSEDPAEVDELYRFIAEAEDLIKSHLPLFIELSTKGLNVSAAINKKVQT